MSEETKICRYCGRIVYHNLKLCTFHGAKELSDYFIKTIEPWKSKIYFGVDYENKKSITGKI